MNLRLTFMFLFLHLPNQLMILLLVLFLLFVSITHETLMVSDKLDKYIDLLFKILKKKFNL
jgi:hypothetical protein